MGQRNAKCMQIQKVIATNMLRMDGASPGKFHGRIKLIHSGIIKEKWHGLYLDLHGTSGEEWPI